MKVTWRRVSVTTLRNSALIKIDLWESEARTTTTKRVCFVALKCFHACDLMIIIMGSSPNLLVHVYSSYSCQS